MLSSIFKIHSGKSERSQTLQRNIIGSIVIKGCSILISLMLVPMTLGYVSSEMYGIWLTLSSIILWLNFFDAGFSLGLKNKLAASIALNDYKKGKALVSTTYFMIVIIFIPICILLEFIIPLVNWSNFLHVNIIYNNDITRTLHILVMFFCIQVILNVLVSVVAAFQQVALSSLFNVIGNFLSLIIISIITHTCQPSLFILSCALSSLPCIVLGVASIYLYTAKYRCVSPSFAYIKTQMIKELFNLGAKFFLIQIQAVILFQTTNILISKVAGPDQVTAYNIAYKYVGVAMMLFNLILTPLWPAFTDAYTKKDYLWMNKTYKRMVQLFTVTALIMVLMIIISPMAYSIWLSNKSIVPMLMTIMVGIYMLVYSWDSLQVLLINGIGSITLQTNVTIAGLILHIPLSLFLGQYIEAYGVVISMILINLFYSIIFTTQIRKILQQKAHGIWIK